jgi:hypothetical protein
MESSSLSVANREPRYRLGQAVNAIVMGEGCEAAACARVCLLREREGPAALDSTWRHTPQHPPAGAGRWPPETAAGRDDPFDRPTARGP